ncbi:MAG: hypothetical protein AVDCRST_MAG40-2323 [uncultured Gemmatimonadaceae bacterium]|uniref:Uncharacterized protein n=1 Tax=uncultured Gemmatimonadaceae bacterium TaxID=246130 RepID=A0A6J4LQM9_9BACT|nr:MAG: hypothetical protein AVDCRST_MAG40-2323 [uncultured Gemmatimonadaceae bacterium]
MRPLRTAARGLRPRRRTPHALPLLRYGRPLHATWRGSTRYDSAPADLTLVNSRRRDVTPVSDLCDFGVPGWESSQQS